MQSKIKLSFFIATLFVAQASIADSISDAISRQELQQKAIQEANIANANSTNMALAVHAANVSGKETPVLFSVMSMGEQFVLRFNTTKGSYIVTNESRDIDGKWKVVKFDGLSSLIQRGNEKPVRVYLSVPDDIDRAQSQMPGYSTGANSIPLPPMP